MGISVNVRGGEINKRRSSNKYTSDDLGLIKMSRRDYFGLGTVQTSNTREDNFKEIPYQVNEHSSLNTLSHSEAIFMSNTDLGNLAKENVELNKNKKILMMNPGDLGLSNQSLFNCFTKFAGGNIHLLKEMALSTNTQDAKDIDEFYACLLKYDLNNSSRQASTVDPKGIIEEICNINIKHNYQTRASYLKNAIVTGSIAVNPELRQIYYFFEHFCHFATKFEAYIVPGAGPMFNELFYNNEINIYSRANSQGNMHGNIFNDLVQIFCYALSIRDKKPFLGICHGFQLMACCNNAYLTPGGASGETLSEILLENDSKIYKIRDINTKFAHTYSVSPYFRLKTAKSEIGQNQAASNKVRYINVLDKYAKYSLPHLTNNLNKAMLIDENGNIGIQFHPELVYSYCSENYLDKAPFIFIGQKLRDSSSHPEEVFTKFAEEQQITKLIKGLIDIKDVQFIGRYQEDIYKCIYQRCASNPKDFANLCQSGNRKLITEILTLFSREIISTILAIPNSAIDQELLSLGDINNRNLNSLVTMQQDHLNSPRLRELISNIITNLDNTKESAHKFFMILLEYAFTQYAMTQEKLMLVLALVPPRIKLDPMSFTEDQRIVIARALLYMPASVNANSENNFSKFISHFSNLDRVKLVLNSYHKNLLTHELFRNITIEINSEVLADLRYIAGAYESLLGIILNHGDIKITDGQQRLSLLELVEDHNRRYSQLFGAIESTTIIDLLAQKCKTYPELVKPMLDKINQSLKQFDPMDYFYKLVPLDLTPNNALYLLCKLREYPEAQELFVKLKNKLFEDIAYEENEMSFKCKMAFYTWFSGNSIAYRQSILDSSGVNLQTRASDIVKNMLELVFTI